MLADLGSDRCQRIIDSYLATSKRLAAELSRNAAARDLAALGNIAHKLVGAANVIGLTSVAGMADDLLKRCKAGRSTQIEREVAALRAHILRTDQVLLTLTERMLRKADAQSAGGSSGRH